MATNSRDYMRLYQARRRQSLRGWGSFNLDLALAAHRRLIALGVGKDDARVAILDAARAGMFGTIKQY